MGSCTLKDDLIFCQLVNEEQIRLNVTFPPSLVYAHKDMVPVSLR